MFITNIHGKEAISTLAAQVGCKAGEAVTHGYGKPGIIGNTFAIKDALKANGARWNAAEKAWCFESWNALETALMAVIAH